MQTWMFFLGLELIVVIICVIWCVKWMSAQGEDEDDKLLEAIAKKYENQQKAQNNE